MDQIPIEILQAARLKTSRGAAIILLTAMAETGMTYDQVDIKLGKKFGHSREHINALVEGTTNDLNEISDIALAMDCEIIFSGSRLPTPETGNG
jgi:hypothetical protein